jgi:hypothetical protein
METIFIALLCIIGGILIIAGLLFFFRWFGKRPDGVEVKELDGVTKMIPLLMRTREGSTNNITMRQLAKHFDEFIAEKRKQGIEYNYRDIVVASLVRVFCMWPKLNRFVMGGRFFQRKWIDVSMMVHKSLRTGDDETAIKCRFTGYETLPEIKEVLDAEIKKAVTSRNGTDKTTDMLGKLPHLILKFVVNCIRTLDHFGFLPDSFMRNNSPFHTSIFITDLKSIGLDSIYHHLYNFGNCGCFVAIGKDKTVPVIDELTGEIKPDKVMDLGISLDERFHDGLYCSKSLRAWSRILSSPWCLEQPLQPYEIHKELTDKEIRAQRRHNRRHKKH